MELKNDVSWSYTFSCLWIPAAILNNEFFFFKERKYKDALYSAKCETNKQCESWRDAIWMELYEEALILPHFEKPHRASSQDTTQKSATVC